MVNQWGRDGNFSGSGGRSSGAAGILIAGVVALALGAGGGYAGARLLGGASTADIAERDGRIAALQKEISDLRFETGGRSDQENSLRQRVDELTKANETLKALADENGSRVDATAQAEIAALKKTIEEAGDVRGELSRTKRSLQVAELQILDLEATTKTQRDEIDKLRRSLTDAATEGDAGTRVLTEQIRSLEASLATARKQAAAATELGKRAAALEDQLARKTAEADKAVAAGAALQQRIDTGRAEIDRLKAALAEAEKKAGSQDDQSAAVRQKLATAQAALKTRESDLARLTQDLAVSRAELADSQAAVERLKADRDAVADRLREAEAHGRQLEAQVAELETKLQATQVPPKDGGEATEDTTDTGGETPAVTTRDPAAVAAALSDMPGYQRLTPDQQAELVTRLEKGDCVAAALKDVVGRVSAVALRNLIRDLGSQC